MTVSESFIKHEVVPDILVEGPSNVAKVVFNSGAEVDIFFV